MSDRIQIQYDAIQQVGARFQRQSEKVNGTIAMLQNRLVRLQRSWEGVGSAAFQAEMQRTLLPAMKRLYHALTEAERISARIASCIRQAEEEAQALFRIEAVAPLQTGGAEGQSGGAQRERLPKAHYTLVSNLLDPTPPIDVPPNTLGNNQNERVAWGANGDLHSLLSWAGVIPALGVFPDLLNGILYGQEGNNDKAWESFLSALIPLGFEKLFFGKYVDELAEIAEATESGFGILDNAVDELVPEQVPADLLNQLVAGIVDNGADPARGIPFAFEHRYDAYPFGERLAQVEALTARAEETIAANPQWVGSQRLAWAYALLMQERGEALVVIPGLFRYNPDPEYSMYLLSATYEQVQLWPEEFGGSNNGWAVYAYEPSDTGVPVIREALTLYVAHEMAERQIDPVAYYRETYGDIPFYYSMYDVVAQYAYDHPDLAQVWLRNFWTAAGVPYPY